MWQFHVKTWYGAQFFFSLARQQCASVIFFFFEKEKKKSKYLFNKSNTFCENAFVLRNTDNADLTVQFDAYFCVTSESYMTDVAQHKCMKKNSWIVWSRTVTVGQLKNETEAIVAEGENGGWQSMNSPAWRMMDHKMFLLWPLAPILKCLPSEHWIHKNTSN